MGDIFRMDFGSFPTVWLCDYDDLEEAFKKDILNDRPYHCLPAMVMSRGVDSHGCLSGPVFSSGPAWAEQRKFMFAQLSNLGMGKVATMDEIISQEADAVCDRMANMPCPIRVNHLFRTSILNVVWRIITGKRSQQSDPQMQDLTLSVYKFASVLGRGSCLNALQMNSWTISKLSQLFRVENLVDICQPIWEKIRSECNEYEADPEGNYIERFKARIEDALEETGSTFHGQDGLLHMVGSVFDIFAAGTETVSTFLEWTLHYMVSYPDVQEKCFQEIDRVLGSRPPNLSDRPHTPYCDAVIQELMRHSPHMALSLSHLLSEDMHFRGHFFPKGTQVCGYHGAIHKSAKTFGSDPETFRPERFIDEKGDFKYSDHMVYFGVGNRRCVGEILGRAEQYLFFVSLVQRFKFSAAGGKKPEFKYHFGLDLHPIEFDVIVEARF